MIARVWDEGPARGTHQEFTFVNTQGQTVSRYSIGDGSTFLSAHGAHVTGTIMAQGFQANAKGMAPASSVIGYDWNSDQSEAISAANNGMLLSNHSYGYGSKDQFGNNILPAYYPGAYISDSRAWDQIMYNAPYYLMVVAAGNDGNTSITNSPLAPNLDKLTGHSTAKNNLVVANANDASINATTGALVSVSINSSSSQGPTDDLRIKPDITGNGTAVYSTVHSSNSAYGTLTGTSMASPNVTGTLLLIQQHAKNVTGNFFRAATLKGLALHTADDAGSTGPDAVFGWGLLNAKKAAEAITDKGTKSIIDELILQPGQSYTIKVNSDGINKLIASISWTDPAGTIQTSSELNSSTARLVNDLDIRITKSGTTFLPWRLTSATANGKGDNTKDPYERIDIDNASGEYTITITHKGTTLSGNNQRYSLIVTGITTTNQEDCTAIIPVSVTFDAITNTSATVNWTAVSGAIYEVRYKLNSATTWTTVSTSTNSLNLTGLVANSLYNVQVRSVCPNGTSSSFSSSYNLQTSNVVTPPAYCTSQSNSAVDENIARVQLGTINNSSTATSGYENFTSISTDLARGQSYTITITPRWRNTVYVEGYAVWIDYNGDGDFNDAGELVWSQTATTNNPVSGTFTVPSNLVNLSTRMRVSMKYNGIPTPCETFNYGQVEDYTINIVSPVVTYCSSKGNNSSYEHIAYVGINNVGIPSGNDGGYADRTSTVFSMPYGTNTLTLRAGFSSTIYREYWTAWIDFNKNGTFESNEVIASGITDNNNFHTVNFNIPSTIATGNTRLRVAMKYGGYPTSCETFSFGEVEDYTVSIGTANSTLEIKEEIAASQLTNIDNGNELNVYPNPTSNFLNIGKDFRGNVTYRVVNLMGQTVLSGKLNDTRTLSMNELASGAYIIEVFDNERSIKSKFIKKD
jgi:trimeric autotransporter adhesin